MASNKNKPRPLVSSFDADARTSIGNLGDLDTTYKDDLVGAINEVRVDDVTTLYSDTVSTPVGDLQLSEEWDNFEYIIIEGRSLISSKNYISQRQFKTSVLQANDSTSDTVGYIYMCTERTNSQALGIRFRDADRTLLRVQTRVGTEDVFNVYGVRRKVI